MRVLSMIFVITVVLAACNQSNDEKSGARSGSDMNQELFLTAGLNYNQSEAEKLYTGKCMICHGLGASEETAIAPPMASVRRRYIRDFSSKEDFVNAVVSFSENPKDEKAMMFNALDKFKVMPKGSFKN